MRQTLTASTESKSELIAKAKKLILSLEDLVFESDRRTWQTERISQDSAIKKKQILNILSELETTYWVEAVYQFIEEAMTELSKNCWIQIGKADIIQKQVEYFWAESKVLNFSYFSSKCKELIDWGNSAKITDLTQRFCWSVNKVLEAHELESEHSNTLYAKCQEKVALSPETKEKIFNTIKNLLQERSEDMVELQYYLDLISRHHLMDEFEDYYEKDIPKEVKDKYWWVEKGDYGIRNEVGEKLFHCETSEELELFCESNYGFLELDLMIREKFAKFPSIRLIEKLINEVPYDCRISEEE